jgi:membrane protein implicated in regulation of membrane protease activity
MDIDLPFHLPGGDIDISGGGPEFLSISPISIAAFVTAFGGIGLITARGLGMDPMTSLIVTVVGSILVALLAHALFFLIFIAPQASSHVKPGELIGLTAEVTAPIPADRLGEVTYVAMGSRQTAQARSATGQAIPRGTAVVIDSLTGTVLNVRPKV